jgi:hypothetical protein
VVVLAVIAGCAPSVAPAQTPTSTPSVTASPTVTPTPTPTPTWNADQAAAIEAVRNLAAADGRIGADPAAFTEKQMTRLLEPFSGGEVLKSTVRWHLRLKEHGYHFVGDIAVLDVEATKPVDEGRGVEVHVTQCQDQRQGKVVDKDGNPVDDKDFQLPTFNLRQYAVRKPPGEDAFRVFGFETINGPCP